MTTISISITIDGVHLHDKAVKTLNRTKKQIIQRVRAAQHKATVSNKGKSKASILGRVHSLLSRKKKYVRPTHDLLCRCRKCEPSHRRFAQAILNGKAWY